MAIGKVYIQKEKLVGIARNTQQLVFDPSKAPNNIGRGTHGYNGRSWGKIYTNSIPFVMFSDTKDLYSNDWHDEHGLEEYADETNGLMRKHYDMDVKWIYKGSRDSANTNIKGFLDYLSGADGLGVWFRLYCDWTKIGRRHVRLVKVDNDAEFVRKDNYDIVVFKTTLRVCDPVTEVTLSNGV